MKIRCPRCATLYRVDAGLIPELGIRARCCRCDEVFPVSPTREASPPPPPASSLPGSAARAESELVAAVAPAATAASATSAGAGNGPRYGTGMAPLELPEPASIAPAQRPAPAVPGFGVQDPDTRARRLARALVSDIVAYHPERREQSLKDGTLREEFREEILKSWEEYVMQVGADIARDTTYFREALNEILAQGHEVF